MFSLTAAHRAKHQDIRSQCFQDPTSLLFDRRRCENQLSTWRRRADNFLNPIQTFVVQQSVGLIDDDGADVRRLKLARSMSSAIRPGEPTTTCGLALSLSICRSVAVPPMSSTERMARAAFSASSQD